MATYTRILYHVVFATKDRRPTLREDKLNGLWAYIAGVLKGMNCTPCQIGGMPDHVHILFVAHPSKSISEIVHAIKIASSRWMKDSGNIPGFEHWQEGYGGFTVAYDRMETVANYIANQKEHHKTRDFIEEYREMLERAGIDYESKYLP